MESDRHKILLKRNSALNMAVQSEAYLRRRNSYIIEPIKNMCEKFQERKEMNHIFLKELSLLKYFKYPKNIKKALLNKFLFFKKNKRDEKSFCRTGLITLFLINTDSLNKYIRTNISLTNSDEHIFDYNLFFSSSIKYLLKNDKINVDDFLEKIATKHTKFKEKLIDIKEGLCYNYEIERMYNKWDNFKEIPIVIYTLLKNKDDYENSISVLKKFNNEDILFAYGLMYGMKYYKRKEMNV